ncbi:MAG: glycerol-3-phosphate ABC transporter ATP-binding protein [Hyphomicrobiales bacterium]|nr:MAG: glycerol-3-phosphate ABC transporter ATP-binding protein [Hyphomicrobiales bacterium]
MITTDKIARAVIGAIAASAFLATGAMAAEPIVGKWKRKNGTILQYSGSGTTFCGRVVTGKYKGQSIGCMKGSGSTYVGKVKALDEGKTYKGKAKVSKTIMKLSGCVSIFCKTETLRRQ